MEIDRYAVGDGDFAASLLFVCATTLGAMLVAAKIDWPRLNWLGLVLWPIAALGLLLGPFAFSHPAEDLGWLAWPAVLATMLIFLRAREARFPLLCAELHTACYWLLAALAAWEAHCQVARIASGVWPAAAALAAGTALVIATLQMRGRLDWPLAAHESTYVKACCGGVLAALALATILLNLESAGAAAPLPYVPIFNPLEIVSVLVVFVLLEWLRVMPEYERRWFAYPGQRAAVAAAFGGLLVTMTVARTVHHWNGVPFALDVLAASTVFQTALSIVWGAAGLGAMVIGARARRRIVWIVGAALMGIVVAKLFAVDLGNTGTLARVISFLGVGVLLLVVGYLAPVPPRTELEGSAAR
jgi:uncharacterized membrane protein